MFVNRFFSKKNIFFRLRSVFDYGISAAMKNDSSMSVRFAGRLGGLRRNPKKGFGSMGAERLRQVSKRAAQIRWASVRARAAESASASDGVKGQLLLLGGLGG